MTNLRNGNEESSATAIAGSDMSDILLIGVNHKTAPIELREKLAFCDTDTESALKQLNQSLHIRESMIISTCNRVEMMMVTSNNDSARKTVLSYISTAKGISQSQLESSIYIYTGEDAVRHLYRVASSLDSMIIGEPQILGQLKTAYKTAVSHNSTGVILNRLLHKAFSVAKRIRSETGIGGQAVSISYAAVELAKKIFDSLDDKIILLVGAGEMAELAVENLIRNTSSRNLFVANRTFSVGVALASRFGGEAIRLEEVPEKLKSVDIIISSTGSQDFIITKKNVKPIMRTRKNRPLFFIDIAVPRDIDPAINRISNAYVYDIDDLQNVITENMETRNKESIKAERIVDESVIKFTQWYKSLDVVPTIKDLREKLNTTIEMELSRTMQTLNYNSDSDRHAFEKMKDTLVKKILHDPTLFLKDPGAHRNKSVCLDLARKLFNLDE